MNEEKSSRFVIKKRPSEEHLLSSTDTLETTQKTIDSDLDVGFDLILTFITNSDN